MQPAVRQPLRERLSKRAFAGIGIIVGALLAVFGQGVGNLIWPSVADAIGPAPLVVHVTWPQLEPCDGGTSVGMPVGGLDKSAVPDNGLDARESVSMSGGGPVGSGWLAIDMVARKGTVAHILRIVPVIYSRKTATLSWIDKTEGGCGGSTIRLFQLQLDANPTPIFRDLGVSTEGDPGKANANINPNQLGNSFTVTESDSTRIVVQAYQCQPAITEFGLRIYYTTDGHDKELLLGTKESPYRVLSGNADNYFVNGKATTRPTEATSLDFWRSPLCK